MLLLFVLAVMSVRYSLVVCLNSLSTKKQTTVSSANSKKNVKSTLYHIENSKTRAQTV